MKCLSGCKSEWFPLFFSFLQGFMQQPSFFGLEVIKHGMIGPHHNIISNLRQVSMLLWAKISLNRSPKK